MVNSGTLLIVVNDLGLVEFPGKKLEEIGFQLVFRLSTRETIEWLEDNHPLLMVLDFNLPDMNASDLIMVLNQKGVEVPPFIVFADQGDERIAVEMMKLGARDYIVKDNLFPERMPFVIINLCSAIRNELKLHHAEEALIEANILNNQIVESAKEGIVVYDSDMRYRSWNPFMENLTGIPSTEIIGKHPLDLFPFLKENGVIEIIAKALRGETTDDVDVPFDIPGTGKSGWASDTTAPLLNSAKEIVGVITTVRDITERKRSELLLRETLLDLKKSQQIARVGSWKLNLTTNEFIASDEALRIFGFSMGTIPKFQEVSDCIHYEDKELVASILKNALITKEPYTVEMRIFTRDNHQLKYIHSVGEVLCNSEDVPIYLIGTNQDITYSKQIENVLQTSNFSLEREKQEKAALINSSTDLIWSIDRNYRLIAANIAFLNSAHWFSGGALKNGDNVLQPNLFSEEMTIFWKGLYDEVLLGNQIRREFFSPSTNHTDVLCFDINLNPIYNGSEIVGIACFGADITEKRKMVEELKIKNEELMDKNTFIQTILDNLPIGLALNKFDEGKAMYMNKRFEEIYGWTLAEITSIMTFFEKVYPDEDYRNQVIGRIMTDINSKDQSKMHWENISITRKDGAKRIVNAVNIPLIEQNTMVSTVMDITELHQIQSDLLKAKAQAEENNNLKTAFLNNISHEIRTPFNGLLGFLSLIQNNDITQTERDEYIGIINQSAARLMDTITDVVEISQIQAGQAKLNISEINIQEILRGIFMRFRPIAEMKGLKLKVKNHLSQQINIIKTDGIKLSTVLSHLIGNAIKFTKSGSVELVFRLKEDHLQSGIGAPQPIELEFSVTDTGIGIPQEKHQVIFERFIQADPSLTRKFEGSGLGLSIAKTYVEMLGGVIWLESEIGRGTTFYFTVPCICMDMEKIASEIAVQGNEKPSPKKGLNILVVEDDDASFILLEIAVKFFAKEVVHAKTGIEAIEFCRNRPEFDLVLMDIKMPGMDGYEATRRIRQFSKNVIIIAQTAYALAGDHEKALQAGCNSYISKPIKRDQLLELVQKYFKI
jgi:PAS domain S-box-containing protein